jgi:hypothetical protein
VKKFGRVNQVSSAAGGDVNPKAWIFADERPSGSGVVKVDVSQEDGIEVGNRETVPSELFIKSGESRGRPGINERHAVFGAQEGGGNRATMAGPIEVNGDGRVHGRKECSANEERSIAKWSEKGRMGSAQEG